MTSITTQDIYEKIWRNLHTIDLSDFIASNVNRKVDYFQEVVDEYINSFVLQRDGLVLHDTLKSILLSGTLDDEVVIYFEEADSEVDLSKVTIDRVSVKYDDDYSYNTFSEYNMNTDTIQSMQEQENITECLSEQKDCSYIECYSYSIYLEVYVKNV